MAHNNERGMALIIALLMTLMVSALGAGMIAVATTETQSSVSYSTMSQARYAAESGVAAAANYLLSDSYEIVMPGAAGGPDALANYDLNVSPVTFGGNPVVLSSDPDVASNYPVADVVAAFQAATTGNLAVGNDAVAYRVRARLLSMRQIFDEISGDNHTIQVWEVTGIGRGTGLAAGEVEVSAIIEQTIRPVFSYGAFATGNGCNAMTFSGNARTSSYDSLLDAVPGSNTPPSLTYSDGNVGTNGNLGQTGNAQINGTLSTPMSGIGTCTANNVTAASLGDDSSVTGGLVQLPQPIEFPTPNPPNPPALNDSPTINNNTSCGTVPNCGIVDGKPTITPDPNTPLSLGNVTIQGGATVVLKAGTYHVNSLSILGNAKIMVDSSSGGPVKIVIDGQGSVDPVLSVSGNGIANYTWDPTQLRIEYAGTKNIYMSGNGDTAAIIYAPNAAGTFEGNADFFGAVVTRSILSTGDMGIHYDRRLQQSTITKGNPVMSSFTWRTF